MKSKLLLVLFMVCTWNALADTARYSIQIAAVKSTPLDFYEQLTGFDSLYAEQSSAGFIKIKLGSYSSREEAEKSLVIVKSKGFPDAFISPYTKQLDGVSTNTKNKHSERMDESVELSELPVWSRLTEEQRKNVVYLDGVLHVREGDSFTPISQF